MHDASEALSIDMIQKADSSAKFLVCGLTPALSHAWKRERSGRCKASAAVPCSARLGQGSESSPYTYTTQRQHSLHSYLWTTSASAS
jgi:hypothetical protein